MKHTYIDQKGIERTRDLQPSETIHPSTGIPSRYNGPWTRPTNEEWVINFSKVMDFVSKGGIIALIGKRGTGKTRLASEVVRDTQHIRPHYLTVMGLFLRIRATYGNSAESSESEKSIVDQVSSCGLLVLDEVQERGDTSWEDRILTHIIDRRYSDCKPTIIIANLHERGLIGSLGESITSRLTETGGVIEMNGISHRLRQNAPQSI